MNRKILIALIVLLCSGISVFAQASLEEPSAEDARQDAINDVNEGKFKILTTGLGHVRFGYAFSRDDVYELVLNRKYHIYHQGRGACFLDEATRMYVAAYNAVSVAAIEAKYGPDILKKAREEADVEYKEKYEKEYLEFWRQFREFLALPPKKNN